MLVLSVPLLRLSQDESGTQPNFLEPLIRSGSDRVGSATLSLRFTNKVRASFGAAECFWPRLPSLPLLGFWKQSKMLLLALLRNLFGQKKSGTACFFNKKCHAVPE